MLTKEALLERLNLSAPGMDEVAKLINLGKKDEAIDALIEHFRNRTSPVYLFDENDFDCTYDAEIIKEAEDVCRHFILGFDLGENIDWRNNASLETTKDPEWMWSLSRQIFWAPLGRAYVMTGDERYAKEFATQISGFITSWPVEEFLGKIGTFGEETDMKYPGNAWRTIETAIRLYCVWLPMLMFFRKSPSLNRDTWVLILNAMADHATFLATHFSAHVKCSNWDTMEGSALFQMGVLFPEFTDSATWKKLGYQRVMNDVRYQFDHDGIHIERTPIYHLTAAGAYLQAYRIAKNNGIETPPYMLPILEKSAEFIAKLVKPDMTTPMIGDADRNSLLTQRADVSVYEGMNNTNDVIDENEMRAFFRVMTELTGRKDFQFFATGGKEGVPPEELHTYLPDAGFLVSRSGWGRKDSYFMVDGPIVERGECGVHSHNDAAHLELQIEGHDVLIDTGRYLYDSQTMYDWRLYFRSTLAHNCVQVDDYMMGSHPDCNPAARGVRMYCHRFECGEKFDLVEVSHNGYAYMEEPVFHKRRVFWLKPDVWVVEDRLTGYGEHLYRQSFNFAPGQLTAVADKENAFRYQTDDLAVDVVSIKNDGVSANTYYGSVEPKGGWVSYGYYIKEPAPQLIYEQKAQAPARFVTVIAKAGSVECAELTGTDAQGQLKLKTAHGNWTVNLSADDCSVELD